jgi:hypothetical protein
MDNITETRTKKITLKKKFNYEEVPAALGHSLAV